RREIGHRCDADSDDQAVDGERVTTGQPDRRAVRACGDLLDLDPGTDVDVVLAVELGEERRDLGAEDVEQWLVESLEDDDLGPGPARRAGHLETDPAAA